ncbi:hypothetical protein [Botrimarina sp.]|uniref:hypothetical protein n=1 Tax=Botrimarina sp. TaxID=2795802 RepID=UPI0032F0649D
MTEPSEKPAGPTSRDPAAWSACPEGELAGLSTRLRAKHRRDRQTRGLGVAAVAVLVVLAAVFWPADPVEPGGPGAGATPPYGGITCGECVEMMPEYHKHLTADADFPPRDAAAMAAHLAQCELCRDEFNDAYPGVLAAAAVTLLVASTTRRRGG